MSLYEDLQQVVQEVMAEFKQGQISLVQTTAGSGPIDNPGAGTTTKYALDATAKGVGFKFLKDSRVVASDIEVTAAVRPDVVPNIKDFIEIDGVQHKMVIEPLIPAAGVQVAWKFIVRKGG